MNYENKSRFRSVKERKGVNGCDHCRERNLTSPCFDLQGYFGTYLYENEIAELKNLQFTYINDQMLHLLDKIIDMA